MSERIPVTGPNRVIEILETSPDSVEDVILVGEPRGEWVERLRLLCGEAGVPLRSMSREQLRDERSLPREIRQVMAWFRYSERTDVRELTMSPPGDGDTVLALDGVQDPGNLGAIMRTAAWFGVKHVVLPQRRAAPVTGTVAARSAGALAHLTVHRVTNLARSLGELHDAGYWVYGSVVGRGEHLGKVDLSGPAVLVVGSEEKGLRPGVQKACDRLVTLPPAGGVGSLNVSVFAGLFLYERWRTS